ncbi:MAG: SCO family protein [Acetobacteraceae bacterium]
MSGRASPARGYALVGLLLAALLFAAGGFLWMSGRRGDLVGGPFRLENAAGRTVTARSFRGRYMLIYFGYTHCPDVCPTTLANVAGALRALGPAASRLAVLFISVDPERDTPAVMGRYTALFSKRIVGLTGSPAEIARVAAEYHVYYKKHPYGPGKLDYSVDHSSLLYLMSPTGRFIAPITAASSSQELAGELRRLMS